LPLSAVPCNGYQLREAKGAMTMNEYVALAVFASFVLLVFMGGLAWSKYRRYLKKKIPLINYHETKDDHEHEATHTHA
jgi:ABC-type nickel/cobalt efflux system permease component RcnA